MTTMPSRVLVAATLAACTATTAPPSSTSAPTRTTVATVAVSRVQAFVALACHGIGMPFQATYTQLWAPPRVGNGRPRPYEVWSEPQPPRHQERFVYSGAFQERDPSIHRHRQGVLRVSQEDPGEPLAMRRSLHAGGQRPDRFDSELQLSHVGVSLRTGRARRPRDPVVSRDGGGTASLVPDGESGGELL
jgi:hypothetical protein